MPTTFQKMHGAGNDFVLLDLREQSLPMDAEQARRLANRQSGIGCDQVLVLRQADAEDAMVRFEVWNADGSTAEQCGNGVRCIAHYLQQRVEASGSSMLLQGPVNTIEAACLDDGQVRVNMGSPDFRPDQIPLGLPAGEGDFVLETGGKAVHFGAVSIGNPHAVVQVKDTDLANVAVIGGALNSHPAFPEGCNVGFAELIDRRKFRLRVFERGAGETLACGSGACAAAVVLIRAGLVDSEVCVIQAGGRLIIGWNGGSEPIYMTGPAVHVFEGTVP